MSQTMKFLQIMSATSYINSKTEMSYYAGNVYETTHTLQQIVDVMKERYGDDYNALTLDDMLSDYGYELTNEFSEKLSGPDYIHSLHKIHHERHPDAAGLSSTSLDCLIPFDDNFPINSVLEIKCDKLSQFRRDNQQTITEGGFLHYLREKHPDALSLAYIDSEHMRFSIEHTPKEPLLIINQIVGTAKLNAMSVKDITNLSLAFDNYNRRVHCDNYSRSKPVDYHVKKIKEIMEKGVIFTP
jgi:hypothetical protein